MHGGVTGVGGVPDVEQAVDASALGGDGGRQSLVDEATGLGLDLLEGGGGTGQHGEGEGDPLVVLGVGVVVRRGDGVGDGIDDRLGVGRVDGGEQTFKVEGDAFGVGVGHGVGLGLGWGKTDLAGAWWCGVV